MMFAPLLEILEDAFWSGLTALGFALAFNVPRRALLACALVGAIGHAARTLLMAASTGIVLATLIGSVIISLLGRALGRFHHVPPPVITVAALIPMVPGTFAYRTMLGAVQLVSAPPELRAPLLDATLINGLTTILVTLALAFGSVVATLLPRARRS
ncbi:MAG: threonine/serine exporter [Chloroflexaceae bacterium]|nr:threonine/serine exporter [Chloroflexaceae bacterium]NJL33337.1 threonine/serine exporter [Chloroflexaceae bacterium]NJO06012.1 threonine/serine exporter [Chloroflexaceae bacterium]